ncbi:hypothetical protein BC830DRAFT_4116 [Chytriomyces sp. MP71]|nr:hypothetical protein BC830DRAFT_4116 [Chytriomyces sp. MP71]
MGASSSSLLAEPVELFPPPKPAIGPSPSLRRLAAGNLLSTPQTATSAAPPAISKPSLPPPPPPPPPPPLFQLPPKPKASEPKEPDFPPRKESAKQTLPPLLAGRAVSTSADSSSSQLPLRPDNRSESYTYGRGEDRDRGRDGGRDRYDRGANERGGGAGFRPGNLNRRVSRSKSRSRSAERRRGSGPAGSAIVKERGRGVSPSSMRTARGSAGVDSYIPKGSAVGGGALPHKQSDRGKRPTRSLSRTSSSSSSSTYSSSSSASRTSSNSRSPSRSRSRSRTRAKIGAAKPAARSAPVGPPYARFPRSRSRSGDRKRSRMSPALLPLPPSHRRGSRTASPPPPPPPLPLARVGRARSGSRSRSPPPSYGARGTVSGGGGHDAAKKRSRSPYRPMGRRGAARERSRSPRPVRDRGGGRRGVSPHDRDRGARRPALSPPPKRRGISPAGVRRGVSPAGSRRAGSPPPIARRNDFRERERERERSPIRFERKDGGGGGYRSPARGGGGGRGQRDPSLARADTNTNKRGSASYGRRGASLSPRDNSPRLDRERDRPRGSPSMEKRKMESDRLKTEDVRDSRRSSPPRQRSTASGRDEDLKHKQLSKVPSPAPGLPSVPMENIKSHMHSRSPSPAPLVRQADGNKGRGNSQRLTIAPHLLQAEYTKSPARSRTVSPTHVPLLVGDRPSRTQSKSPSPVIDSHKMQTLYGNEVIVKEDTMDVDPPATVTVEAEMQAVQEMEVEEETMESGDAPMISPTKLGDGREDSPVAFLKPLEDTGSPIENNEVPLTELPSSEAKKKKAGQRASTHCEFLFLNVDPLDANIALLCCDHSHGGDNGPACC